LRPRQFPLVKPLLLILALAIGAATALGAAPPAERFNPAQLAAALLAETNRVRHEQGRAALGMRPELNGAADDQAAFMALTLKAQHFSSLSGAHDVVERIRNHGLDPAMVAENVASCALWRGGAPESSKATSAGVVGKRMDSPGHRANMLAREFTQFGGAVRVVRLPGDLWVAYGVQVFYLGRAPQFAL
jgi:uncharacterized protein YkwD